MTRRYIVTEPLRIDILAADLYGSEQGGTVEALLTANPGMAAGEGYAAVVEIMVPDAPEPAAIETVNPWE